MASEKKGRTFVAIPLGDAGQVKEEPPGEPHEKGSSWTFALHLALRYGRPRRAENRQEDESAKVK